MDYLKKMFSNSTVTKLGQKIGQGYKLGRKMLEGAINLGEKVVPIGESMVKNPYLQTALSLLPYGSTVGKAAETGVNIAKVALQKGKQLNEMLDRGEALYNQFRSHSSMNQSGIKRPPEMEEVNRMRSQNIERKPQNIPQPPSMNPEINFKNEMDQRLMR